MGTDGSYVPGKELRITVSSIRCLSKDFREMNLARDTRLIQKTKRVGFVSQSLLCLVRLCRGTHFTTVGSSLQKSRKVPFAQGVGKGLSHKVGKGGCE